MITFNSLQSILALRQSLFIGCPRLFVKVGGVALTE